MNFCMNVKFVGVKLLICRKVNMSVVFNLSSVAQKQGSRLA